MKFLQILGTIGKGVKTANEVTSRAVEVTAAVTDPHSAILMILAVVKNPAMKAEMLILRNAINAAYPGE